MSQKLLKTVTVVSTVRKFTHIQMNMKKLSSISERIDAKVPYILARPSFSFTGTDLTEDVHPEYFVRHTFLFSNGEVSKAHLFAVVNWPRVHPHRNVMGKPVQVWYSDLFETNICNHFLPIENIVSRVITVSDVLYNEEVLVTIPMIST